VFSFFESEQFEHQFHFVVLLLLQFRSVRTGQQSHIGIAGIQCELKRFAHGEHGEMHVALFDVGRQFVQLLTGMCTLSSRQSIPTYFALHSGAFTHHATCQTLEQHGLAVA
jgi:hypothetical protein